MWASKDKMANKDNSQAMKWQWGCLIWPKWTWNQSLTKLHENQAFISSWNGKWV